MSAVAATLGTPDELDAWDEAKNSPLVDTLVEAAVISVVAMLASATIHILASFAAPVPVVR
jgi:hypothetical protein